MSSECGNLWLNYSHLKTFVLVVARSGPRRDEGMSKQSATKVASSKPADNLRDTFASVAIPQRWN